MTESHTYINTAPATTDTVDSADIDFLTDANVYYNLPPPLPMGHCRGASLPRGRFAAQHQLTRASSSCPASPKLSAAALPTSDVLSHEKEAGEAHARPAKPPHLVTSRRNDATLENGGKDALSVQLKARGTSKPRSKKLSHTRSFDFDHKYQNLVRVASKPRSRSFSFDLPWRRKKKVVDATPPGIREDSGEDGHIGIGQNQAGPSKPEPPSKPSPRLPEDRGHQVRHGSSSSSGGSSSSSSENDCGIDDCSAKVRSGVTYLREHGQQTKVERNSSRGGGEVVNALYHTTATLPVYGGCFSTPIDGSQAGEDQRSLVDVNANLDEWLRKKRWRERKRYSNSKNFRSANESGEVDISILYASDGGKWKKYLHEVFTQLVPEEDRTRSIRVEASNVEEIEENLGRLQAVRLKDAKLQIVIMSPCFLDHIAGHGKSELGQVFRPEKVLALLLGVDDRQLSMAHLSALYSYSDWHKLKVRDMDCSFVHEVLTEGVKILNNCELYSKYQDERNARFKVTPRKVTEMQQLVHLMLNDPVDNKNDIEILIESPGKPSVTVEKYRVRNPYTIEFRMPDEFMFGSSLLLVTVLVQKKPIGSRQLKCESSLDSMRALLTTISNPTYFMCQALNINPASEELDQKLTEAVRAHVPLCKLKEETTEKSCSEFPTWVHFSAYYGLERLTWALLEIPGGEAALNTPNQHSHTPSLLAYQKGFHLLAHTLEDAALMASLAAKLNYEPVHYKNVTKAQNTSIATEIYSSPPPPRPLHSPLYDHPPSPQEVLRETLECSPTEVPPLPAVSDDTNSNASELPPPPSLPPPSPPPPPPPPYKCQYYPSVTSPAASVQPDSGKQDGRYLEMKAAQDCTDSQLYEYSEDVYHLVTAWLEKTNIKAFVEKHQEKIDEVKSKLDLNTTRDESQNAEAEAGACAAAAPETGKEGLGIALKKHENMAEEFYSLIKGAHSRCELPSDSPDDPVHQATSEMSPDPEDQPPTYSASTSGRLPEMQPELTAASSELTGLKTPPSKMPPTKSLEDRLPEPPPRPDRQHVDLKPKDVNASTESSKHSPKFNTFPMRSRSSSVARVTHTQDEVSEVQYAIIH